MMRLPVRSTFYVTDGKTEEKLFGGEDFYIPAIGTDVMVDQIEKRAADLAGTESRVNVRFVVTAILPLYSVAVKGYVGQHIDVYMKLWRPA